MEIKGPKQGNKGPHYGIINSGNLKSDYVRPSIPTEPILKRRIMVIDDNSDIGLTLRMGLEINDKAIQVDCYDNPVTALMEFKPDFYDLLRLCRNHSFSEIKLCNSTIP